METKTIDLKEFRGNKSTLFTGRPQGELARKKLKLDKRDKDKIKYILLIPQNTTSFSPSFYLGLIYDSIKKIGLDNFDSKYQFKIEESENKEIISVIKDDLEDAKRQARNAINDTSSFRKFLGL